MGKKRRHSEEVSRPRKKHKLQSDPDAVASWGEGEGGWTETVRRKMKPEVPDPALIEKAPLNVETDTKEKPEHNNKHKHKHRHKHKHKHRQKCTTEDNLRGAKAEETRYITGTGGVGRMEEGRSGGMEGERCLVRRKHKTKHKRKRHHKTALSDETEPPVPDPVWAAISIEGDSSEGEDQFSVLHSRWVRSAQEGERKLREEVGGWKKGRWSILEIRRLKRNVRDFMKEHGVKDLSAFIFNNPNHQYHHLYQYIAKNINRPLFPIYRKMLRVFDITNFVGRWSKEMESELLRLHKLHGNRWRDVGRALGVSGQAALDKFRAMCRGNKGEWSEEEEQRLVEAMEHFRSSKDGDDLCLLPSVTWEKVAERVGTRNLAQCRMKWVIQLSWKEKGGKQKWTSQDNLTLLQRLAAVEVVDEEEVEWGEMCKGWDSARSPYYLRTRWSVLRRDVPNYRLMTFQENLEYLLTYKVPTLERQSARQFN